MPYHDRRRPPQFSGLGRGLKLFAKNLLAPLAEQRAVESDIMKSSILNRAAEARQIRTEDRAKSRLLELQAFEKDRYERRTRDARMQAQKTWELRKRLEREEEQARLDRPVSDQVHQAMLRAQGRDTSALGTPGLEASFGLQGEQMPQRWTRGDLALASKAATAAKLMGGPTPPLGSDFIQVSRVASKGRQEKREFLARGGTKKAWEKSIAGQNLHDAEARLVMLTSRKPPTPKEGPGPKQVLLAEDSKLFNLGYVSEISTGVWDKEKQRYRIKLSPDITEAMLKSAKIPIAEIRDDGHIVWAESGTIEAGRGAAVGLAWKRRIGGRYPLGEQLSTYFGLPLDSTVNQAKQKRFRIPMRSLEGYPRFGKRMEQWLESAGPAATFISAKTQLQKYIRTTPGATGVLGKIGKAVDTISTNINQAYSLIARKFGGGYEIGAEERLKRGLSDITKRVFESREGEGLMAKLGNLFSEVQHIGQVRSLMDRMIFSMALNLLDARGIKGSRISTRIVNLVIKELGGDVANPETFINALDQIQDVEMLKRQNTAKTIFGRSGDLKNLYKSMGILHLYRPIFSTLDAVPGSSLSRKQIKARRKYLEKGGTVPSPKTQKGPRSRIPSKNQRGLIRKGLFTIIQDPHSQGLFPNR